MTPEIAKCMNRYFENNEVQIVTEYMKRYSTSLLIKGDLISHLSDLHSKEGLHSLMLCSQKMHYFQSFVDYQMAHRSKIKEYVWFL